jgi:SPP1 family predicted phage head-tail adaptor
MIDGVIKLIAKTATQDADKAIVETETEREVLCSVESVGRNDFFAAAQAGLDLSFVFKTHPVNYQGENELEYNGKRYEVTRTYQASNDVLEIYAGTAVGYGPDSTSESDT